MSFNNDAIDLFLDPVKYEDLTLTELKIIAKEKEIKAYYNLNKAELIQALYELESNVD